MVSLSRRVREETLIATLTFLQLPLSFRPDGLQPALMRRPSAGRRLQPARVGGRGRRAAALGDGAWDVVATRAGLLLGFLALAGWFALRALERYQRSL